jgi:hypothetical protein
MIEIVDGRVFTSDDDTRLKMIVVAGVVFMESLSRHTPFPEIDFSYPADDHYSMLVASIARAFHIWRGL